MKKLVTTLLVFTQVWMSIAQNVTLYDENFDDTTHTFNLTGNTPGIGYANTQEGHFTVNDVYNGGTGNWECFWPVVHDFTAPNIADQPAGIVFSPNSNYLHVQSNILVQEGIQNAALVDYESNPSCQLESPIFTKMIPTLNTQNLTDVILSFYWLCGGAANTYGSVYYKADGGPWTLITSPITNYSGQPTWTQQFISLPEFEGLTTLKFGFRFNFGEEDPDNKRGFSIDDVRISATDLTVGVQDPSTSHLTIHPNPVGETLNLIGVKRPNSTVFIFNQLGSLIKTESFKPAIDVSDLDKGVYYLLLNGEGVLKRKRFVKT